MAQAGYAWHCQASQQEVISIELSGLPLLNIDLDKLVSRTESEQELTLPGSQVKQSPPAAEEQVSRTKKVLISVSNAVAAANGIDLSDRRIALSTDEDTGDMAITVISNETGDVIRRVPADGISKLERRM